jgi:uncharacterized protein YcfJ
MKTFGILAAGVAAIMLAGCATPMDETGESTTSGAILGAVAGGVLGHNLGSGSREDRALGAAAGALVGGALGHNAGVQRTNRREIESVRERQNTTTVWVTNSNGSRTPVTLRATQGGAWIGPRGEYYDRMPEAEQLQRAYGF